MEVSKTILLFKIFTGTRKIFFEIYRQFGFVLSKPWSKWHKRPVKGLRVLGQKQLEPVIHSILFWSRGATKLFFSKNIFFYSASTHVLEC